MRVAVFQTPQNKVEAAEKKQRETQEQLDVITQQILGIQARSGGLKAEVQKRKSVFQSSEVRVQMLIGLNDVTASHIQTLIDPFRPTLGHRPPVQSESERPRKRQGPAVVENKRPQD